MCAVNFANNTSRSGWTWCNLWNLLTINVKYKYFHKSLDGPKFYLQVYILSWLVNNLRFTVFRLMESAFLTPLRPWHDLIINPPCRTALPITFPKKFVPHLPWKALWWGETLCPSSIGKSCRGICFFNICKELQTKTC